VVADEARGRSTGDRWASEATDRVAKVLCRALGARLDDPEIQQGVRETKARAAADARRWQALSDAGFDEAIAAQDYERAAGLYRAEFSKVTADRVLAAGRRARMSGENERPEPSPDSLPGRILAAGRRRRGEI
jgi:hypothetical protein